MPNRAGEVDDHTGPAKAEEAHHLAREAGREGEVGGRRGGWAGRTWEEGWDDRWGPSTWGGACRSALSAVAAADSRGGRRSGVVEVVTPSPAAGDAVGEFPARRRVP